MSKRERYNLNRPREYYVRSIHGGFKRRVTKEVATNAMSDAADAGYRYQVIQNTTFWNKIHQTIVET